MKAQPDVDSNSADAPFDRKAVLGDALRRRILSMELAPGAVVDELALCDEFGLSRPPVRELLRQIAAEGYIELEANRAPRVAAMSHDSLHAFFLAAPLIYTPPRNWRPPMPAKRRSRRSRRSRKISARPSKRSMWKTASSTTTPSHLEIGRMAHNDYLMPSLRRLLIDHARLGKIFYRHPTTDDMQRDLELACDQHDQIVDAIQRRDPDAAADIVRAHFELSRRRMAEYAAPAGVEVALVYEG